MREVKEAEFWLKSAKDLFDSNKPNSEKYTVVTAQVIHSIIKANDALTLKFLRKRAIRHDDAPQLFLDLIKFNKIPPKFADLRKTVIIPAINTKSRADYKGIEVSRTEAERWIRMGEKFLKSVKECVGIS